MLVLPENSTTAGPYLATYNVNVSFCMPYFSSRKIILHHFHVDDNEGKSGIEYGMIIGSDLMIQLGLYSYFKHQVLQLDGVTIPKKEPVGLLSQSDLTSHEVHEVETQTAEPVSTREYT